MSKQLGIIADDFTGANDTGVHLARKGLHTRVVLEKNQLPYEQSEDQTDQIDVWIIDTDSRSMKPDIAFDTVVNEINRLKLKGVSHFYKKIDSTLRGNITSELLAVQNTIGSDLIVIAPAFPKMGRTVVDGHLYVHGVPVNETEFGKDPKTPVLSSYIPDLVGDYAKFTTVLTKERLREGNLQQWAVEQLSKGIKWVVCDTEVEADFEHLTQLDKSTDYSITWAGSAGLIDHLQFLQQASPSNRVLELNAKKVLVVSGSLSNTTSEQVEQFLIRPESHVLEIDPVQLLTDPTYIKEIVNIQDLQQHQDSLVIYVAATQVNRDQVKLLSNKNQWSSFETAKKISEGLGQLAHFALSNQDFDAIIMTGGDTAKDICNVLTIRDMELLLEVDTGLPLGSIIWNNKKLLAVTKAGGFGSPEALVNAVDFLKGVQNT